MACAAKVNGDGDSVSLIGALTARARNVAVDAMRQKGPRLICKRLASILCDLYQRTVHESYTSSVEDLHARISLEETGNGSFTRRFREIGYAENGGPANKDARAPESK
ncbi:hypothetical protein EVAR_63291_1 [Eumeta japonica]|uniref:Uncharacterized protein n=1 Tax=Eumeta variegata TaxID=151549 RepID=A0A4C2A1H9_EUMVA|nr:hypothetical protein EVAR_63291_1 [Eumeta japonica]